MRRKSGVIGLIVAILVVAAVVLGVQYFTSTGLFFTPGKIIFSDSLSADEKTFIDEIIVNHPDLQLKHDVTITKELTHNRVGGLLYQIHVPVTDFYAPLTSITWAEAENYQFIPFDTLTNQQKLLAVEGEYFLDTLNSGAIFDYFVVTGSDEADADKITTYIQAELPAFPDKDAVLTIAQTGVTALSRYMNSKLSQVGQATYFAEKIGPFLSSFDLTHTSNESSFSPAANSSNICSKPAMIDALTAIGLDIVELTGNHNQDCGDQAALDTIAKYQELGIQIVGGGATATEAAKPLQISKKGNNVTLLGYNLSTGGYTLDNTPGANYYTHEKAIADIAAAKARGDTVIVDVQYYECNNYDNTNDSRVCDYANSSAGDQIGLFRELIDMGADIVIGTAAHQPQTYELYHNGAIYYGLGNLFFDQIWWPGTTRSLILIHYFYNNQLIQTRIVPTIYDNSMQTSLMDTTSAEAFINRLNQARPTI